MDNLFTDVLKYLGSLSPELLLILGFLICMVSIMVIFRYFGSYGLVCYSVVAVVIANLQVLKLGVFSYINEPVALGTIVFTTLFTTSDLITEHYGANLAKRTIYLTFLIQIFVIVSMLVVIAHPEVDGKASEIQAGLQNLFTPSLRLLISSLISFMVSQHIDIAIFAYLKQRHGKNLLWVRGNLSTLISGTVDTFIFSILAWILLSPTPIAFTTVLVGFIGFSQAVRMLVSILSTPLLYLSYRIKNHEL